MMDTCPRCGGSLIGDGYTTVRHCENVVRDDDLACMEPDAPIVFCDMEDDNEV